MGLIPFWRFPSDAATVSTSNPPASAGYAASNVQKQTLQKVYKDAGSTTFHNVDFDFGSAIAIDTAAVFGHDILETDVVTFQFADDSAFTVNLVNVTVTWHEKYFFEKFAQISKRYARYVVNKGVDTTSRKTGRVVIGTSIELDHGLKTPGDRFGPGKTTSTVKRTTGGQQYGNLGVSINVLRGMIPALDRDDIAELNALQEAYQTVTPFVTVVREGLAGESVIYGTLDKMVTPSYVTPDDQDIAWNVTEQK